jgi:ubiquinone/menaquinone biosynthesis C-methylase UbiE
MQKNNISHWYYGWFYDKVIAPNQYKLFGIIKQMIPKNSTLLDVACATGMLGFYMSDHCKQITGIDLSLRNITIANKNLSKSKISNLKFIHYNALKLEELIHEKYDFVAITYAIHEMPEEIRLDVIKQLLNSAKNILIADYAVPQQKNITAKLNRIIEFIAGKEHFKNFKSFCEIGGIEHYLKILNLSPKKKITFNNGNTDIFLINQ